jgi:hypothetical protein
MVKVKVRVRVRARARARARVRVGVGVRDTKIIATLAILSWSHGDYLFASFALKRHTVSSPLTLTLTLTLNTNP